MSPSPPSAQPGQEIIDRVRALAPGFRKRAEAAEEARRIPNESAQELLAAGIARILVPPRFGGYGLGLDTWFEVAREISKADASHGWCASLIIHHPHIIGMRKPSRPFGPTAPTLRSRRRCNRGRRLSASTAATACRDRIRHSQAASDTVPGSLSVVSCTTPACRNGSSF